MLIELDKSLVSNRDGTNIWTKDKELIIALENLAIARREGKHALISDRTTLQKISQCPDLSSIARGIYHKLYEGYSEFKAYRDIVSQYVRVVSNCPEPKIIEDSLRKVIEVSPRFFGDSETIQKTILLGENLSDTSFYETIAKVYLVWQKSKLPLAVEPKGGGGSTIVDEYGNIQQTKKRWCLCIVDSDCIAPNITLGATAKSIKNEDNPNCVTTSYLILDVREIENLIPHQILAEVCSKDKNKENGLRILAALKNSNINEIRKFIDIKKGTDLRHIISQESERLKIFWQSKLSEISNIASITIDSWCQENWQCEHEQDKPCTCSISFGFGDKILDNTNNFLKNKDQRYVAQKVEQGLREEWEKIGKVILDWCIATRAIRA